MHSASAGEVRRGPFIDGHAYVAIGRGLLGNASCPTYSGWPVRPPPRDPKCGSEIAGAGPVPGRRD